MVGRFAALLRCHLLSYGAEYDPQPPFGVGTPDKAGVDLVALSRDFLAPLEVQLRAPSA